MRFFEQIHRQAQPIWDQVLVHPFIRGIAEGSLAEDTFQYYLGQDYKYLVEYGRARAAAVVKAHDLATMQTFAESVNYILQGETIFHRRAAEYFGRDLADFLEGDKAPTNQAYASYLLAVAHTGTFAELVAACLPCLWGYGYVGRQLLARGLPDHPLYANWIATYGADDLRERSERMCALLDRLAERADSDEQARIARHYLTCTRYEWMFFDAAYKKESWPV
jgi:thiaminase (transcriptional activator TenA)